MLSEIGQTPELLTTIAARKLFGCFNLLIIECDGRGGDAFFLRLNWRSGLVPSSVRCEVGRTVEDLVAFGTSGDKNVTIINFVLSFLTPHKAPVVGDLINYVLYIT